MEQRAEAPRRVAVVTGGGQGIGLAIGEQLAAEGAHVVVADLNAENGMRAADHLGGSYVAMDVTDISSIARAASEVFRSLGRVDILVNNAGIAHEDASLDLSMETWNRVMAINLTGPFAVTREFGRIMTEQGSGAVVNISSISAFVGTSPEFHLAYDVSKAGVSQMARTLAVEWAPLGVRVNAVAPGRTRTPILEGVGDSDPGRMEQWLAQVPQRRIFEPAEVAAAVCFLASEAASGITGHTMVVDGGQTVS
ncbi:SDR family NAD(P)-dependent oxidoreductase [Arthrobacter sp. GCM10027362]|uniref:SDR family NAD(P)-dependent oxidoreductase n=1 Tax=Arthrobacter sp. GCM10027362 TaxID=3273379 RepID=UPI003639FDBB